MSLAFESYLEDIVELIRNKKNPPHSRVLLMEFISFVTKGKIITA